MDSKGFPAMFGSPQKEAKTHESSAAPKAFDRRRPGSKTAPLEKGELHQALGFGKAAKKKPAALEKAVRKNVGNKKPKKAGKKNMQKETASLEKEERKNGPRLGKQMARTLKELTYLVPKTQMAN